MNFIRKNKEKPNKNSEKSLDLPPSLPLPSFSLDVSVPAAVPFHSPNLPANPVMESSPSSSSPPLYARFARGTFELREPELLSPSSPRQTLRHRSSNDSGTGFRSSGVRDEVERLVVAKRNVVGAKSGRDSPSIKAPSIRSVMSGRDSPLPSLSEALEGAHSQPKRTTSQPTVILPRAPTPPPPSPPKIVFAKGLPTPSSEKSLPATPSPPVVAPPPVPPSPILIPKTPKTPPPKTLPLSPLVSSSSALLSSPTASPASRRRAYSPLAAFQGIKDNSNELISNVVNANGKDQDIVPSTTTRFSSNSTSTSTSTPTTPASTLFMSSSETTEASTPSSPNVINPPTKPYAKPTSNELAAGEPQAAKISTVTGQGLAGTFRTASNKNGMSYPTSSVTEAENSPAKGPSFTLREKGYFSVYPDRDKVKKTIENFDTQHKASLSSPISNGEPLTSISSRPSKSSISTVDDEDPNLQAFVKNLPSSVSRHTTGDSETSSVASNILANATFGETNRRVPRGARLSRVGIGFNNGIGAEDAYSFGPGLGSNIYPADKPSGSASPVQTLSRKTSGSVFEETLTFKPINANGSTSTLNSLSTHSREPNNSAPSTPPSTKIASKSESVRERVRALEEEREKEREKERLRRNSPWVRKDGTVGIIKPKKEEKERNGSRSVSSSTVVRQASSPVSSTHGEDVNFSIQSQGKNGQNSLKDGSALKLEATLPSYAFIQSESPVSTLSPSKSDQLTTEPQTFPKSSVQEPVLHSVISVNNHNTPSRRSDMKPLPPHLDSQNTGIGAVKYASNSVTTGALNLDNAGAGPLGSSAHSTAPLTVPPTATSVRDTVNDNEVRSAAKPPVVNDRPRSDLTLDLDDEVRSAVQPPVVNDRPRSDLTFDLHDEVRSAVQPPVVDNKLRSDSTIDLDDDPFVRGLLVRQGAPNQRDTPMAVDTINLEEKSTVSNSESADNEPPSPVKFSVENNGKEESSTSVENTPAPDENNSYEISKGDLPLTPSPIPVVDTIEDPSADSTHVLQKRHKHNESVVSTYSNESDNDKSEEVAEEVAEENIVEDDTPPSPPYPLERHLCHPYLFHSLLKYLSYVDVLAILSLNHSIRRSLTEIRDLREEILERFLHTIGYNRWIWEGKEPLVISVKDLNAYLRGASTPMHEYATVADAYLAQQAGNMTPASRILRSLAACCRSYTRLAIRLREHAEAEYAARGLPHAPVSPGSPTSIRHARHLSIQSATFSADSHDSLNQQRSSTCASQHRKFSSPLFRLHHAPLLRVFVPSTNGAWLSDESVLECEKELKRAGVLPFLRPGDVVWDTAVAEEMNAGRLVWDGSYLIDLDYSYTLAGELPRYLHSLSFPPSYFHKVIQANGNPLFQIDISPWSDEIINNVQLVQDKVTTTTPQGAQHSVLRWTHRSRFQIIPGTPILDSDGLIVDPKWVGTMVVEAEGTNEGLGNLLGRCGEQVAERAETMTGGLSNTSGKGEMGRAFRLIRSKSRPGEIWLRCVSEKEKLV